MKYPVKFIVPAEKYHSVSILSDDFPKNIDKSLHLSDNKLYFSSTIALSKGLYHYKYQADNKILTDPLRSSDSTEAIIQIGDTGNNGIIFDIDKSFVCNESVIMTIGFDSSLYNDVLMNIQRESDTEILHGHYFFSEGSYIYQQFTIKKQVDSPILGYFEITSNNNTYFLGTNGLKKHEWSVQPFEISKNSFFHSMNKLDITAIYNINNSKMVKEFEKHIDFFKKLPIDYINGSIPEDSPLMKILKHSPESKTYPFLTCLLQSIFLENNDINASLDLLGRFIYEYKQDISEISFALSDNHSSFWNLNRRNFNKASLGIVFQILGSMTPEIIFGEEIGLVHSGEERSMYWTKTKWNKNLYELYQKLILLRKNYPVLRNGNIRFIRENNDIWGVERFIDGQDSIFILLNQSQKNYVVDLTKIMNYPDTIIDLLKGHAIKRKKACTIFKESIYVFIKEHIKNE